MVNIPMTLLNLHDDGFHLLVEVVVFGHLFQAVLDTGASRTVFDKTTAEKHLSEDIQMQKTDLQSTGLGTNTMESYSLLVPDLRIGVDRNHLKESNTRQGKPQVLHLRNFEVAVLDLSTINYAYGLMDLDPVIGVIGGDILTTYGGIIDYRKMELRIGERKMRLSHTS